MIIKYLVFPGEKRNRCTRYYLYRLYRAARVNQSINQSPDTISRKPRQPRQPVSAMALKGVSVRASCRLGFDSISGAAISPCLPVGTMGPGSARKEMGTSFVIYTWLCRNSIAMPVCILVVSRWLNYVCVEEVRGAGIALGYDVFLAAPVLTCNDASNQLVLYATALQSQAKRSIWGVMY
jgi:hypothetical protein